MGTIFDRLVPCMSGSSNLTFRMPFSFHSDSTRSTETVFFSAIAIPSTPASVVPRADLQAQPTHEPGDLVRLVCRRHGENPALASVAAHEGLGDDARRLQVVAVEAERGIRVLNHDERCLWSAHQHL